VLDELRSADGVLGDATRRRLALKAFERTAAYDAAIATWLTGEESGDDPFPAQLSVALPRAASLRYGENPHQRAALYGRFLEMVEPLHGKELSFNNLVDVQAALALVAEFDPADAAAVAILKHNTPCGAGLGDSPLEAYERAFATDPDSPFGGIIVSNRPFDLPLAEKVDEIFTEVLIAPEFSDEALGLLRKKKNRRLLRVDLAAIDRSELDWKRVYGGVIVQEAVSRTADHVVSLRAHGAEIAIVLGGGNLMRGAKLAGADLQRTTADGMASPVAARPRICEATHSSPANSINSRLRRALGNDGAYTMLLQEIADIAGRPCPAEVSLFFAVVEQHQCRKAPQPVSSGQFHVLTDINLDFGQPYGPGVFLDQLFEERCDHQAG